MDELDAIRQRFRETEADRAAMLARRPSCECRADDLLEITSHLAERLFDLHEVTGRDWSWSGTNPEDTLWIGLVGGMPFASNFILVAFEIFGLDDSEASAYINDCVRAQEESGCPDCTQQLRYREFRASNYKSLQEYIEDCFTTASSAGVGDGSH